MRRMALAWTRLQYHPLTFFKNCTTIPISCHRYRFYALSQTAYTVRDDRTNRLVDMCWQMTGLNLENAESSTRMIRGIWREILTRGKAASGPCFNYTMITTALF